jgi:hypothetical protein
LSSRYLRNDAASQFAFCLIFHNVQAQTCILCQLAEEGEEFDDATLSRLSPYLTEHVNRFGKYTLNLDRDSPALDYTLDLRPGMEPILATESVRPACEGNGPFRLESLPYPLFATRGPFSVG